MCAEAFNPDDEEEDTEPRVVHPKTDEQRCRLQEACRDILLFKTLEQVRAHTHTRTHMQCSLSYTQRLQKKHAYNIHTTYPQSLALLAQSCL